ncbi:Uncharacterised protein [Neisseria animaloris]|uniref:hypothetical protein n=1 Tax=Neisseria animaloris TaxID=326522 RepID=UPI000A1945D5|nr:hypothetical protein [Neisseria animaloris]OSI06698.1 hypothetical protein BWD08_11090 [Neisseria animaloris]VEH88462.1 Uncharacterised protein [Neisseria animaloris]
MKKIYFIYKDYLAFERQSDGVELCIIPELNNNKIYFYCNEYMTFWDSIDKAGNLDQSCDLQIKGEIRPANLQEICLENLCNYIDTVKEYIIENGKIKNINYIHLK